VRSKSQRDAQLYGFFDLEKRRAPIRLNSAPAKARGRSQRMDAHTFETPPDKPQDNILRVMGIDPGIAFCGVAVVEVRCDKPPAPRCLSLELLRTKKEAVRASDAVPGETDDNRRIELMRCALQSYLKRWCPQVVSMELYRPFGAPNAAGWKTAMVTGLVSGMARAHGAWLLSYTPQQMKKYVTGDLKCSKDAVIERVRCDVAGAQTLLDYFPEGQREHLADATGHAMLGMANALQQNLHNFAPNPPTDDA
jgi:Holliday junction resolvasome RuvABC endonuclease subunit